jgi:hypothetical protein
MFAETSPQPLNIVKYVTQKKFLKSTYLTLPNFLYKNLTPWALKLPLALKSKYTPVKTSMRVDFIHTRV